MNVREQEPTVQRRRELLAAYRAENDYEPARAASNWKSLQQRLRSNASPRFQDEVDTPSQRPSRHPSQRKVRWVPTAALAAAAMAAAVVLGWWWSAPRMASPEGAATSAPQATYESLRAAPQNTRDAARRKSTRTAPSAGENDVVLEHVVEAIEVVGPVRMETPATADPAPTRRERPVQERVRPATAEPTNTPPSASTIARELEILRNAQLQLSRGAPDAALEHLRTHASEFPRGALVPEREGLRAIALCQLRQPNGPVAAERFLAQHFGSALRKRVQDTCLEKKPPATRIGERPDN